MQEIVILLSSLVGVATAAAVRKTKLNHTANTHIQSQINSLRIEKDLLGKTISRVYDESNYTKTQRDQLLSKYQHQLGTVLSKLEKLEEANKHPDFGPVGDGLISLLDQKLSKFDDAIHELSSKITSEQSEKTGAIQPKINHPTNPQKTKLQDITQSNISKTDTLTTKESPLKTKNDKLSVTNIPKESPFKEPKPSTRKSKKKATKPNIAEKTANLNKFKALPEPNDISDDFEDDSEDINKLKGDIQRVLAKLDQAEVE